MDLEPNGEEQQVIDATADYLRDALPLSRFHQPDEGQFSVAMRQELAELGWFGMGLSERAGGFGFSAVEEMLVFREIGRHLGPAAALGICLAAKVAEEFGQSELARAFAAGEHSAALGILDPNSPQWRLFDPAGAEFALLLTKDEARLVSLSGSDHDTLPCYDRSMTMGAAMLDDAPIIAVAPLVKIEAAGRLLTAAMLVGIAEAVTAMIGEYAKIRHTFGKPIGSWQAVRHPIAEMATRAFAARQQLFLAAVSLRDDTVDAALQVTAAKLLANDAALLNVDANIQLHGGIATTDEHDAHLYLKRANVLARLFGAKALIPELNSTAFAA